MTSLVNFFRENELSSRTINAVYEVVKDNLENSKMKYKDVFDYWLSTYHKPSTRYIKEKYIRYNFGNTSFLYDPKKCKVKFEKKWFFSHPSIYIDNRTLTTYHEKVIFFSTNHIPRIIVDKCRKNFIGQKQIPSLLIFKRKKHAGHIVVLKYKTGTFLEYYYNPGNSDQIRWLQNWNENLAYENQDWSNYSPHINSKIRELFNEGII